MRHIPNSKEGRCINLNFNSDNNIPFIQILWLILVSFFCSFAKELNDYAKSPKKDFLLFVSEVLLSGVCGCLAGVLGMYVTKNMYLITFTGGIGGILGLHVVKLAIKVLFVMKNVDLKQIDIDKELNDINDTDDKDKK